MDILAEAISTFSVECYELLDQWEEALLVLEDRNDDADVINEAFRAIHTLKGSSAMIGFERITNFAHVAESVFEEVRGGALSLSKELAALLLRSGDLIRTITQLTLEEQPIPENVEKEEKELLSAYSSYLDGNHDSGESQEGNSAEAEGNSHKQFYLYIKFDNDMFMTGMDPLSFVSFVESVATVENVFSYESEVLVEGFDPEECKLSFELLISGDVEDDDIFACFSIVEDSCEIRLVQVTKAAQNALEHIRDELDLEGEIINTLIDGLAQQQKEEENKSKQAANNSSQEKRDAQSEASSDNRQQANDAVNESRSNRQLRVDAQKLDSLINLVGEMVIMTSRTSMIAESTDNPTLIESVSNLRLLVEGIRDHTLQLRMVPIGGTFNRFKRVVRDISNSLGKDIQLEIMGAETELDKSVIEKIADPLTHLVRNAIDHGIEDQETRIGTGKPAKGLITLNAYHDSGNIVIDVTDDGKGINKDRILEKAIEKGLVSEENSLTEGEILKLVFEPGFSTASAVTNISGRGVGMDVVKQNIDALRGQVDIRSVEGVGTTFSIRLPLTLAIIDGFRVRVGQSSYIIPLETVTECVEYVEGDLNSTKENYINLRGEILPFIRLKELFCGRRIEESHTMHENIVVVKYGEQQAGILVDELMGEYQTVIKPLNSVFKNLQCFSGATILGSGEVALIIDVPSLILHASLQQIRKDSSRIPHELMQNATAAESLSGSIKHD